MSNKFIDKIFSKRHSVCIESNELIVQNKGISEYLEKIELALNVWISSGDRVAILIDKGTYTPLLMLAIMKLNATFIPIDNNLPLERIRYILDDSKCKLAIVNEDSKISTLGVKAITIVELMNVSNTSKHQITNYMKNETAYIIYTSGSTGLPKGVKISYESLHSFFECFVNSIEVGNALRFISLTSVSFDISILELLLPFVTGGYLYICSNEESSSIRKLRNKFTQKQINSTQLTPSRLLMFSYDAAFKTLLNTLELILLGGENLTSELVNRTITNPKVKIYNLYGPTEATIWCSYKKVSSSSISIGKPFSNTLFHVKDEDGLLIDGYGIGELYLSGKSLMQGYVNLDLDRERLIYDEYVGDWLYRTGDLVEKMINGEYRFIARIDNQLKLNGYRVEIGEIESNILKIEYVNECCITYFKRDEVMHLVCFVSTSRSNENEVIADIRDHLSHIMPEYMIPKLFRFKDKLPINVNGKLDRRRMMEMTNFEFNAPEINKDKQQAIEQKIFQLINEEITNKVDYITMSACEDLTSIGLSSIGFIKLIVSIESAFEFEFSDDDLIYGNLNTLDKITSYVMEKCISGGECDKKTDIQAI